MDRLMRRGIWKKQMGFLLRGKRIGIIGLGRIGKKVAELLHPFGVELVYCDLSPQSCSVQCGEKTFQEILGWADILSLHVSTAADHGPLIGRRELLDVKPGSLIVNLARGDAVDEQALCEALRSGRVAGAALDVFSAEPYSGPLNELDNVILTPHIGSYAREGRIAMEIEAVQNLIKAL
jgi:D-3-phosphoglycerate dehydrogenase